MDFYFRYDLRESFSFRLLGWCGRLDHAARIGRLAALDGWLILRGAMIQRGRRVAHIRAERAYKPFVDENKTMRSTSQRPPSKLLLPLPLPPMVYFISSSSIFPITFNLRFATLDVHEAFLSLFSLLSHFPK